MEKGYVQVYTGNGKGKTTAMLGLALRAAGAGLQVYIGQFIKNMEYSETKAIREFLPNIKIEQYGPGFIYKREITKEDREITAKGMEKALKALHSGEYDIIMLDEIHMAVSFGLLSVESVLEMIRQKPPQVELILTGRNAAAEIIAAADLVSEIAEIKHYYTQGVPAREGIEK